MPLLVCVYMSTRVFLSVLSLLNTLMMTSPVSNTQHEFRKLNKPNRRVKVNRNYVWRRNKEIMYSMGILSTIKKTKEKEDNSHTFTR